jgi:hypothetical protein
MRFPAFRAARFCASAAVVEAACQVAFGARLKRAGMHCTVRRTHAILALRCLALSSRYEDSREPEAACEPRPTAITRKMRFGFHPNAVNSQRDPLAQPFPNNTP